MEKHSYGKIWNIWSRVWKVVRIWQQHWRHA